MNNKYSSENTKYDVDYKVNTEPNLNIIVEKESNYVRVRDVDLALVSELVSRAKGPNRSLRKFASEIGTSASTLHRIIEMKNSTNSRDGLIRKIAEHADPDSGVTLEQLFAAHGLEKQSDDRLFRYYMRLTKHGMTDSIISEITSRGYSAKESDYQYTNTNFSFDAVIESDAVGKETGYWAFEHSYSYHNDVSSGPSSTVRWFDKVMAMIYRNELNVDKISYVVQVRAQFDQIVNRVKNYKVPDEISVILINKNKIEEEFIIPMISRNPRSIFF